MWAHSFAWLMRVKHIAIQTSKKNLGDGSLFCDSYQLAQIYSKRQKNSADEVRINLESSLVFKKSSTHTFILSIENSWIGGVVCCVCSVAKEGCVSQGKNKTASHLWAIWRKIEASWKTSMEDALCFLKLFYLVEQINQGGFIFDVCTHREGFWWLIWKSDRQYITMLLLVEELRFF